MANITRGNGGAAASSATRLRWPASFSAGTRSSSTGCPARGVGSQPSTFAPTFNVVERQDGYYITADVPGVAEEDIDVTVQDNYLVISGNRNSEERKEGDNYYVYERRYGNFSRAFALPENADPESVEANLKDGVLEVKVGKRESARPRKIPLGQRIKEKLRLGPRSTLALAVDDEAAGRIVGRDGDRDPVAEHHADAVAPGVAGQLGQYLVAVLALHPEVPALSDVDYLALQLNQVVLAHSGGDDTGTRPPGKRASPLVQATQTVLILTNSRMPNSPSSRP